MLIVLLEDNAPFGKINSTLPSEEIIEPPAIPISLLTNWPSGVPNPVESDSLTRFISALCDLISGLLVCACITDGRSNAYKQLNIFMTQRFFKSNDSPFFLCALLPSSRETGYKGEMKIVILTAGKQ
jgi:hypothetical protein